MFPGITQRKKMKKKRPTIQAVCLEIALITKPSFTAHQYGFVVKIGKNLSKKK